MDDSRGTEPAQVVTDFLRHLERNDAPAALALLTDDIEWRNTGLPTIRGKRVRGVLRDMVRRGIGFAVEMHDISAEGETVRTVRTDVLTYRRYRTAFPVQGDFRVIDGRIALWDDHFSWLRFALASLRGVGALVRR